jgi:hypothetical protein
MINQHPHPNSKNVEVNVKLHFAFAFEVCVHSDPWFLSLVFYAHCKDSRNEDV